MSNVLSIFRRDLKAYFTSPIGYIFIMVFVTVSVGLYITTFFAFPVADMRMYFENLPLMLCIFIPAVTMRVWAEERKENTWEMLLTFPMQSWELVIGKFLAALVFFAVALAATITVPVMLFSLGDPDGGAIFGGYLGTLLLGAMFLAMGIFFSGFFKDQIVAFVVTLLACFLLFLLGTDFVAGTIDASVRGLGSLLSDLLGLINHYNDFYRGVIDFADVLYFVVWTALFLFLNILYIDGRSRPNARSIFGGALALAVGIGMVFNYLMNDMSLMRLDLTEDNIYTVSEAAESVLEDLDVPIQVSLYITPRDKMPTQLRTLEQDITGKLEEFQVASGNKLQYKTVHLEAANLIGTGADPMGEGDENASGEDEKIEKRQLEKGVQPFSVQAIGEDLSTTNTMIYSSIGIAYRDKAEEVINGVLPQVLDELEYRIVATAYKLSQEKPPVVALVAPTEAINIPPEMRQLYMQMGQQIPETQDPYRTLEQWLRQEKYDVRRVELTAESPLPEDVETLVVVNPRGLNERQRWEIARAIRGGKSVMLAVQQYVWDYRVSGNRLNASQSKENPDINALLASYGLGVQEDVLMDVNKVPLRIQTNDLASMLSGGMPVDLPTHILVNEGTMSEDSAITNRLGTVFYIWGTALDVDTDKLAELGLSAKVLMQSSDQAWTRPSDNLGQFEPPVGGRKQYPLMVEVQGQFPDPFDGQERPAWPQPQPQPGMPAPPPPADEGPAEPVEAKPGKLLLLGSGKMFDENFLNGANLDLFLKSVDSLTLTDALAEVRGRKPVDRVIKRPDAGTRTFWQVANYGLANVIIAGIGIGLAVARRRSRDAYTSQFTKQAD